MRKLLLLALGFCLALASPAFSQSKSVQLSQDPLGPIPFDTTGGVTFPGHIQSKTLGAVGALPPVLSGCGTTPSFTGSDTAMRVTTGSAATTCTITFGSAHVTAPACVITPQGAAVQPTYTVSATAIAMTVDVASTVYNIICIGPD